MIENNIKKVIKSIRFTGDWLKIRNYKEVSENYIFSYDIYFQDKKLSQLLNYERNKNNNKINIKPLGSYLSNFGGHSSRRYYIYLKEDIKEFKTLRKLEGGI